MKQYNNLAELHQHWNNEERDKYIIVPPNAGVKDKHVILFRRKGIQPRIAYNCDLCGTSTSYTNEYVACPYQLKWIPNDQDYKDQIPDDLALALCYSCFKLVRQMFAENYDEGRQALLTVRRLNGHAI